MKIGDLVKVLSVFDSQGRKYIGKVGVLKYRPLGLDNTWAVFLGDTTLFLADDRLEVINESR